MLKQLLQGSFFENIASVKENFSSYVEAEIQYSSAIGGKILQSLAVTAGLLVVAFAALLSFFIGAIFAVAVVVPKYYPNADIPFLMLIIGASLIGIGILSLGSIGIIFSRLKTVINQYSSHWN